MQRITRKAAKSAGLKHYFTGRPCKRGHIDTRIVSSFVCMECARQAAKGRYSRLDLYGHQRRRERNRRLWTTPDYRARALRYQRERDQEVKRKANREWKKANRGSCTDRQNQRHASYLTAFVEEVSLSYLFERDKGCCQLCGDVLSMTTKWPHAKTPTRDHIVPLSKGGTHERANLQLACAECNVRKGSRCA